MPDAQNIRNYGAVGDGETDDTQALQSALDGCHARGGGLVVCPPGIYQTGTLWMRSHTTLHLEAGATLRGSPRRADYSTEHNAPYDRGCAREHVSGAHLLYARHMRLKS